MEGPNMQGPHVEGAHAEGDLPFAACDAEAARLLPWHITGRLPAADTARVTQHLDQCATCRADLASQRALRERLRDDGPLEYAPQAGLAATLARIDELGRELAVPPRAAASPVPAGAATGSRRAARWRAPQWLAAAVVVQAIGLGVLGSLLLARSDSQHPVSQVAAGSAAAGRTSADYETLSTPAANAPGGQLRAVFAADMTLGQLADLLSARGLQVLSGPTEAGVYTLGLLPASHAAAGATLRALRADPRVRFAEPTAGTQVSP